MIIECDVVVVGAGHAGCEAALAAARHGCRTTLLTIALDQVAAMSCNPAIGGLAKGQLVREIDALGGEMAKVTDATGIQFRMLNTGRGPAVQSPRAQADRDGYKREMRRRLLAQPNLLLRQDTALALWREEGRLRGVIGRSGARYAARAVIVTTGTFLQGLIHVGQNTFPGGRFGEPRAETFSDSLRACGLELGRLKTGTPPRVNGRSVDFNGLVPQPGDEPPRPFSFSSPPGFLGERRQLPCWLTATNPETHRIIRENLHRAPLFTGQIKSAGPRYCPSVEDKVSRFADKESHQVFLEPEGGDNDEFYCNGIPTSVPIDVQEAFVHTIRGLEQAEITRYGYAIEYDFAPPTQLGPNLECKAAPGLFLAGQINGTSGYEEAAAQGLMAGINAALKLRGEAPFVLRRDEAYIGVLVDDLVTKGTQEPYRMFTSRAEYRLLLRQDNADRRLMPHGRRLGLVSAATFAALEQKERRIAETTESIQRKRHGGKTLEELLRRPETKFADLLALDSDLAAQALPDDVWEQVAIEVKYEGYIARQMEQIERFRRMEDRRIPADFDFTEIHELSKEARTKLAAIRPLSIGQASRVSGVTPADISLLLVHLHRRSAGGDRT